MTLLSMPNSLKLTKAIRKKIHGVVEHTASILCYCLWVVMLQSVVDYSEYIQNQNQQLSTLRKSETGRTLQSSIFVILLFFHLNVSVICY